MAWIQENFLSLLIGIGLIFFLAVTVALTSRGSRSFCGCGQNSEGGCACAQKHMDSLREE
ncbi:MAG: hypothetical protein PHP02_05455 [Eubacteriales bacterium]|nr:hypothetical protein [Eubacteriales bacterium]